MASALHRTLHQLSQCLNPRQCVVAWILRSGGSEWLTKHIDQQDPAALSLAGMLYLRTAIAAAERQDRSTTTTLIAAADRAASQLGRDADYWQTSFGPTNVQLHRVATSLDLGDVPWVIEHGSQIDTSHLPAERSVAHQIDLARAYSYAARDDDALADHDGSRSGAVSATARSSWLS